MTDVHWLEKIETPRMWLRCPYPGDGEAVYQGVDETLTQLRAWPDSLPWAQKPQSVQTSEDYCQTSFVNIYILRKYFIFQLNYEINYSELVLFSII
jgi:hypothetical protein